MNDATLSALRAAVEARAAAIRSDATAVRALSAPVEAALADLRAAIIEQKDALARMEAEAGAALAVMLPTAATVEASPLASLPTAFAAKLETLAKENRDEAAASTVAAFDAALAGLPSSAASPRFAVEILPARYDASLGGMDAGQSELPPTGPQKAKAGRAGPRKAKAAHLNGSR